MSQQELFLTFLELLRDQGDAMAVFSSADGVPFQKFPSIDVERSAAGQASGNMNILGGPSF